MSELKTHTFGPGGLLNSNQTLSQYLLCTPLQIFKVLIPWMDGDWRLEILHGRPLVQVPCSPMFAYVSWPPIRPSTMFAQLTMHASWPPTTQVPRSPSCLCVMAAHSDSWASFGRGLRPSPLPAGKKRKKKRKKKKRTCMFCFPENRGGVWVLARSVASEEQTKT